MCCRTTASLTVPIRVCIGDGRVELSATTTRSVYGRESICEEPQRFNEFPCARADRAFLHLYAVPGREAFTNVPRDSPLSEACRAGYVDGRAMVAGLSKILCACGRDHDRRCRRERHGGNRLKSGSMRRIREVLRFGSARLAPGPDRRSCGIAQAWLERNRIASNATVARAASRGPRCDRTS